MSDDEECYKKNSNFDNKLADPEVLSTMFSGPLVLHPNFDTCRTQTLESQINKLKVSMDSWKEIVVNLRSVLFWEKQWHPTGILVGNTILFMLIWLLEPNLLTLLSLIGLVITIADYGVPIVASTMFKPDLWTNQKQKDFEEVCSNIILYKTKMELLYTSYSKLRSTNPKAYFGVTVLALGIGAWIGGAVNNLFLCYILITTICLLPGMAHNGMLVRWSKSFTKAFNRIIENAKTKVGHIKKE